MAQITEERDDSTGELPGPDDVRGFNQTVWQLAWPAIALNSLQVVNGLLDTKFVASLGRSALNASGAAQGVLFLLISLAIALGTGATALVSRFYGAGDNVQMIKASRQATSLALVFGLAITALAVVAIPGLSSLYVPKASPAYQQMLAYLFPAMTAIPGAYVFFVIAGSLRAVGDTKTPMYVSGFQLLVHMILNFFLIFPSRTVHFFGLPLHVAGANLGIAGAAWAFAISYWVAFLLYFPASSRTILGQTWKLQVLAKEWVWRILRIALPASLQTVIRVSSFNVFSMALQHTWEGENTLGAMRVGVSMESIAFMPAFGYMIAASALVGQSLGMKSPERAEKLAWAATKQAVLLMSGMSVVFLLFAHQFAHMFVDDPVQQLIAARYLQIIALTEPLFGFAMVLTGAHSGAGDTARPTWVLLITNWIIRVPAVWIFAVYFGGGSTAAWWVMASTQAMNGILMIILFKQGKWKEKKV